MSRLSICLFVLFRPTLVWATRPTEYRRRRYCVVSLFERSHSHNGILHNRLFTQKHVVGVSVRIYYRSQPYTGDMYNTVARNATVSNRFRRRPHSDAKPQVSDLTKPGNTRLGGAQPGVPGGFNAAQSGRNVNHHQPTGGG